MLRGATAKEAAPKNANPVLPPAKKGQSVARQPVNATSVVQLVAPDFVAQPTFYRNKRVAVDVIEGEELKAYARSLGITQRDVDGLTQDRLRQNCKARIAESMAD